MAFLIKLGSMTIVTSTPSEAVHTFDRFMADSELAQPVVRTIEGVKIEIERLRSMVSDTPEP
jgi:hypothetical protein